MSLKDDYEAQQSKSRRARIYFPSGRTVKEVASKMLKSNKTIYNWCAGVKPVPDHLLPSFYELTGHTAASFAESVREKQGETTV
jgi:transposase